MFITDLLIRKINWTYNWATRSGMWLLFKSNWSCNCCALLWNHAFKPSGKETEELDTPHYTNENSWYVIRLWQKLVAVYAFHVWPRYMKMWMTLPPELDHSFTWTQLHRKMKYSPFTMTLRWSARYLKGRVSSIWSTIKKASKHKNVALYSFFGSTYLCGSAFLTWR